MPARDVSAMRRAGPLLLAVGLVVGLTCAKAQELVSGRALLDATGVHGGLVVHLGCGTGERTAELARKGAFLVQGLSAEPSEVAAARRTIERAGQYGAVSADLLSGPRLPYVDGLVNALLVEDAQGVPAAEFARVLAPRGVLLTKGKAAGSPPGLSPRPCALPGWSAFTKPWPAELDEWPHALYDASNNAVNHDRVVGPPRHIQWISGPPWSRSHDHLASVSVAVSSGGRLFAIVDEGSIASVLLPARWFLVARDAFNGVELWRKPVSPWEWHLRGFRSGPPELSRTLVADGDRVYAILGYGKPVVALDAASGKRLRTYAGTRGALEIVQHEGTLYVIAGERSAVEEGPDTAPWERGVTPRAHKKRILALDAASGRTLWEKADAEVAETMPLCLAVGGGRVFLQTPEAVLCLAASSGEVLWRAPRSVSTARRGWSTPTLVVYEDVVLSADRIATERAEDGTSAVVWSPSSAGGNAPQGELIAFSADTGDRLWSAPCQEGYNSPVDVLVSDGLVWSGQLVTAKQPGITVGRDPRTGEIGRERPPDKEFFTVGMGHHRCYRNRATSRYLVLGRAGVEFVDVKTGAAVADHWVRGVCQYGVLPCNGLLYAPPHSCACFIEGKSHGFLALAPALDEGTDARREAEAAERLVRGPAYSRLAARTQPSAAQASADWPTYRHDARRSGCVETSVGPDLTPAWRVTLGGRLSSLVVSEGLLLVAQVDRHVVHARDADSGKPRWTFTAGGRVDSPPTVHAGRVSFGCTDGWVYSLRAADGALAWRFRAAPEDRRVVVNGQLESPWPVHGSVLVQDGSLYCVAGRSGFTDGGMAWYRLNALTGDVLAETRISGRDPETGLEVQSGIQGTNMPGALPDVLSSDGESVFMRHTRMDLDGNDLEQDVPHLFSPNGFLDDTWWHRTYWMWGTSMSSGYGGWPRSATRVPAGRILTFDDQAVYGFGRDLYVHYGSHVGLDSATVFHYRPRDGSAPRWTLSRIFAAPRDTRPGGAGTPRNVSCVGVEKSTSLDPTDKPLTVGAWVKTDRPNGVVVARGANVHGYALYLQRGHPHFAIRGDGTLSVARADARVPSGQWTHLAGVLTPGNTLQLYINGELRATAEAPAKLPADPGELMEIGADASNSVGEYESPFALTGSIDDVRIYHRALGAEELRAWVADPATGTADPDLVLRLSFDRGDARDDSGNGNHGTVENATVVEGRIGRAMAFTGKSSNARFATAPAAWEKKLRIVVRAMVLTGSRNGEDERALFLAGAGDYREPAPEPDDGPMLRKDVVDPFEVLDKGGPAVIWSVSPDDGRLLARHSLSHMPVFDGMIAANGRLYLATTSGQVLCFRGR